MDAFFHGWHQAARTTVGLFWTAFWAFGLGYLISALIQVLVTRDRMERAMGDDGPKAVLRGTFFGFVSSSCSFSALSTTRALFSKGAGLIPSLAFLLSSTNLVIELGIVIAMFLGWQFVVGEYLGGLLLIGVMWGLVSLTRPESLIEQARTDARNGNEDGGEGESRRWQDLVTSKEGWLKICRRYTMEWAMVWKDVVIGFTVAGVIAAFVPTSFFQALFVGAGQGDAALWEVALQALVGPLIAFFTFIGSMGNIPLAAVLYDNGVSFGGLMAFMFSDLVVLPVLRIQAKYYGWRMALYILGIFLAAIVAVAIVLHVGFDLAGLLPSGAARGSVTERSYFELDYSTVLGFVFVAFSGVAAYLSRGGPKWIGTGTTEKALFGLAVVSVLWLAVGMLLPAVPHLG